VKKKPQEVYFNQRIPPRPRAHIPIWPFAILAALFLILMAFVFYEASGQNPSQRRYRGPRHRLNLPYP